MKVGKTGNSKDLLAPTRVTIYSFTIEQAENETHITKLLSQSQMRAKHCSVNNDYHDRCAGQGTNVVCSILDKEWKLWEPLEELNLTTHEI
jgi:hypothetical protein